MALLQFKHLYTRAGLTLADGELPDHLAVVLEFTATGDVVRGGAVAARAPCRGRADPAGAGGAAVAVRWVLAAVCATLRRSRAEDRAAVLRLAREGPPAEEVGLDPYGAAPFAPPEYMPQPSTAANAGAPA